MDAIEKKSWVLSVAIHAALVLMSLFSFGVPVLALRSAANSLPPIPPDSQRHGEVVLAPDSTASAALGGLPPLPPLSGQPAPSADVIQPAETSFPGNDRSRGDRPGHVAPVELPRASMPSPLSDALRGQHSNPSLSVDAASRAAAADHVDFLVNYHYPRLWRGYASQITNKLLVIEVVADERSIIRKAALFHCTTGVPELDRAICDWLVEQGTSLPRLPAGQALRFAVNLP